MFSSTHSTGSCSQTTIPNYRNKTITKECSSCNSSTIVEATLQNAHGIMACNYIGCTQKPVATESENRHFCYAAALQKKELVINPNNLTDEDKEKYNCRVLGVEGEKKQMVYKYPRTTASPSALETHTQDVVAELNKEAFKGIRGIYTPLTSAKIQDPNTQNTTNNLNSFPYSNS
jgi:hypothetical protein